MTWRFLQGKLPLKGCLTVAGGFLIHFTIGTQLAYGNVTPYLVSYVRNCSSADDLRYVDGTWISATCLIGMGLSMFLGGVLEAKLGPRLACLLSTWFLSAGMLVTYFTVKTSFPTTVLTYGVMFGLGAGTSYAVPIGVAIRWFPEHPGFVGGAVALGFNVGAVVFNQIITVFVNPHNLSPDTLGSDGDMYFGQAELLERVPTLFLLVGGVQAFLQFLAFLLLSSPPPAQSAYVDKATVGDTTSEHRTIRIEPGRTEAEQTGEETETEARVTDTEKESQETEMKNRKTAKEKENKETEVENRKTANEKDSKATETSYAEAETDLEVPPLQMLKTRMFWSMWCMFLLASVGGVFLISQYKAYGQTFISDDRFFSIVGSSASVLSAVAGVFWGWIADRFTFKRTLQVLFLLSTSLAYTLSATAEYSRGVFLVWVCLIFSCQTGLFTLMPPACGRVFGRQYLSLNYGLLFTSQILTAAASAFLGQLLIEEIGYHGLFRMIGGIVAFALLIAIIVQPRTPDGKPV